MADVKVEIRGNGPLRVIGEIEIDRPERQQLHHPRGAVGLLLPLRTVGQQALLRRHAPRLRDSRLPARRGSPLAVHARSHRRQPPEYETGGWRLLLSWGTQFAGLNDAATPPKGSRD